MRKTAGLLVMVFVVCTVVSGCASAKQGARTAVDTTHAVVVNTDQWLEQTFW